MINCDVAVDLATGVGYVGIICRDYKGSVLTASAHRIFDNSPLISDALGLREAISLAKTLIFNMSSWNQITKRWWKHVKETEKLVRFKALWQI